MNCTACNKIVDSGKYVLDFVFCDECIEPAKKTAKKLFSKHLKGIKAKVTV